MEGAAFYDGNLPCIWQFLFLQWPLLYLVHCGSRNGWDGIFPTGVLSQMSVVAYIMHLWLYTAMGSYATKHVWITIPAVCKEKEGNVENEAHERPASYP